MKMNDQDSLTYLSSHTMAAISSTLSLAADITLFDCMELWTQDSDGAYYCPYVYANAELQQNFPYLLTGHHSREKLEHVLSPKVKLLHRFVGFIFSGLFIRCELRFCSSVKSLKLLRIGFIGVCSRHLNAPSLCIKT
jgi:hypothetical protein